MRKNSSHIWGVDLTNIDIADCIVASNSSPRPWTRSKWLGSCSLERDGTNALIAWLWMVTWLALANRMRSKWRCGSCKSRHYKALRVSAALLCLCHCRWENIPLIVLLIPIGQEMQGIALPSSQCRSKASRDWLTPSQLLTEELRKWSSVLFVVQH